jgi:hypothetical protein
MIGVREGVEKKGGMHSEEREETSSKTRNDKEKSKGLKLEASPETLVGVERRWERGEAIRISTSVCTFTHR